MKYECPFCSATIEVNHPKIIHSGFSDCGFLYCSKCGDLLTWNMYDVGYRALMQDKAPWVLTEEDKHKVESSVIGCPCGGRFTFVAKPRCPNCNTEIPGILPDKMHWVQLKNLIDGEKVNIWRTQ